MIQAIKTNVIVDEDEKELSIDYEDDMVYFYLDNKFLFSMSYDNNFKQVISMIKNKW